MLFRPGSFLPFVLTITFFVLVIVGGYSCDKLYVMFVSGKLYLQQQQLDSLKEELAQCKAARSEADAREAFYKRNMEVLKQSAHRRIKSAVDGATLDIGDLFNVPPR